MTPPTPILDWSDDGAPRSRQFGDIYFSPEDGLAESRAVFLAGCHLPQLWEGRRSIIVGELGFGTGLNIVALMDLWRRERRGAGHLQIFSVEAHPLSRDEAARALAAFPEVSEAAQALLSVWPSPVPGRHRVSPPGWGMTLDLHIADVAEALASWDGKADAWFLDGFAPSTNPDMWAEPILQAIAGHSAPGARLATFTVAGAVRRGLAQAGFTVAKVPGHGRKRERLEAIYPGPQTPSEAPPPTVAVIGAGIAGASVARALQQVGIAATVFEAEHAGAGGSGFPVGLVTPRLDAGDLPLASLAAQAVRRAMALYQQVPGAVLHQGVTQLAGRNQKPDRFARIAGQPIWAEGEMILTGADESALQMQLAGAVNPAAILKAWLAGAPVIKAQVSSLLSRPDGGWELHDDTGQSVGQFDHVVLCAATGCRKLAVDGQPLRLPLSGVAGQADWVEADAPAVSGPMAWGGYAVPFGSSSLLFGATHDRGIDEASTSLEARARNLQTLRDRFPDLADQIERLPGLQSRAAVRAVTPDRLPLAGPLEEHPGLHILSGLGSRGLAFAPLLAEQVVATLLDLPRPLARAQSERLSPARDLPTT